MPLRQPEVMPLLAAPAVPMMRRAFPHDNRHSVAPVWYPAGGDSQDALPEGPVVAAAPEQGPVAPAMASGLAGAAAAAHQILWMAAMGSLPLPAAMVARREEVPSAGAIVVHGQQQAWRFGLLRSADGSQRYSVLSGAKQADGARWSGDGWALVRGDGDKGAGSSGMVPTYGASQIGAVLRYRLVAGDARRPTAYIRGYGAMNGTDEKEAAAGFSLRPLKDLPLAALAEVRASRFADGTTHARPALSLVSEFPPVRLGKGLEIETYAQGGYVGGAGATAFVDGQLRVEKPVSHLAGAQLRVGGGIWGGAQRGAGRLDIGPQLRMAWSNGHVGGRLALDWRVRVEGNAAPSSGPAITLSAGF